MEDSNGNVILENEIQSNVAMKASTAALMNSILHDVVNGGTGSSANFSGMTLAGKTGTTNDLRDRYFVGYSPYYVGACWVGYESNSRVSSGGVNPAAILWNKVMSQIHAGLENKNFFSSSDLVQVTVCADSGHAGQQPVRAGSSRQPCPLRVGGGGQSAHRAVHHA